MNGIDQLKQDIRAMLDLQDKVSTWVEALMWESRVDLPGFRSEKAEEIKRQIVKHTEELQRLKAEWL